MIYGSMIPSSIPQKWMISTANPGLSKWYTWGKNETDLEEEDPDRVMEVIDAEVVIDAAGEVMTGAGEVMTGGTGDAAGDTKNKATKESEFMCEPFFLTFFFFEIDNNTQIENHIGLL